MTAESVRYFFNLAVCSDFDLALDDLHKRDIGFPHAGTTIYKRRAAGSDLTHALGNQVDEKRSVRKNESGLLNEIGFHGGGRGWG